MYVVIFLVNVRYNSIKFNEKRPETLYDAFNVTRHATFDEFKESKDRFISQLDIEEKAFNKTKSDLINVLETKLNNTLDAG